MNANKQGYKKTKIGWIPEDWDIQRFGDIFKFLRTVALSRENLTYQKNDQDIISIHYGDIHSTFDKDVLDFDLEQEITFIKNDYKLPDNFDFLIEGDLIIADVSEDYEGIGKCIELKNVKGKKIIAGLHTFAVRDNKEKTAQGFRAYIFKHPKISKNLKRITTGISVYGISKNNLSKILIPLPPLPEQKKIAEILSTWDEAIEKTRALIAAKEKLKKALMQQLLTGKKRFQEFSENWKEIQLKSFLIPTIREVNKPKKNFLALGIRSHGKGTFLKPNFDPNKIEMEKLYEVHENDLIVNITFAWEGAIAIAKKKDQGALVSHRFPKYLFEKRYAIPEFFKYVIKQKKFIHILGLISPGGAGRNRVLNKTDFLKIKWKMPSVIEQKKIASVLETADKEIELLNKKLDALQRQKKGLMQVLLTGKVRVKTK